MSLTLLGTIYLWVIFVHVPAGVTPGAGAYRNTHSFTDPYLCEQVNTTLQAQAMTTLPGSQVSPCIAVRVEGASWNPKPAEIERAMGLPRHSLLQPGRLSTEAAVCED